MNKEVAKNVKEVLLAIKNVRSEATDAVKEGNTTRLSILLCNLSALEACLVIETNKLVDEIEKEAA